MGIIPKKRQRKYLPCTRIKRDTDTHPEAKNARKTQRKAQKIPKENAIILIGQVKNFDLLAKNYQQNIQKPLEKTSETILITSKQTKYQNPRQNEDYPIDHTTILKHIDITHKIYDDLENQETQLTQKLKQQAQDLINTYGGAWEHHSNLSTYNSLKQLYSLNLLHQRLPKRYKKYIILRSDIYHDTPFNPEWLKNKEDATLPEFASYEGHNDRYAILNQRAYTSYTTRYKKITRNPEYYHAETYLKKCLDQDGITVRQQKEIRFRLMRSNGELTDPNY